MVPDDKVSSMDHYLTTPALAVSNEQPSKEYGTWYLMTRQAPWTIILLLLLWL